MQSNFVYCFYTIKTSSWKNPFKLLKVYLQQVLNQNFYRTESIDKVTIRNNIMINCSQIENQAKETQSMTRESLLCLTYLSAGLPTFLLPSGRPDAQLSKPQLGSCNGLHPGRREGQKTEKSQYLSAIQLRLFLDAICMCCLLHIMTKMQFIERLDRSVADVSC